jgi:hypothetical protein
LPSLLVIFPLKSGLSVSLSSLLFSPSGSVSTLSSAVYFESTELAADASVVAAESAATEVAADSASVVAAVAASEVAAADEVVSDDDSDEDVVLLPHPAISEQQIAVERRIAVSCFIFI